MTKPDEIDFIFQLILDNCVLKTLETLLFGLRKFFGVPCRTPILALLSHFWVKIRVLVRPNLQRWTEFGLLVIFWLNFDDFPFLLLYTHPKVNLFSILLLFGTFPSSKFHLKPVLTNRVIS